MKSLVLESPRATLRFHDLAGGAPLVFVHGLGCASSCDYPAVARDPALASRRAILVDLLGSGFSDRPEGFEYTVAAHARVVVALIDALGIALCDLYGHSMGGAVAIVAATMLPGRVGHLALSEPNLDPGGGVFSRSIAGQTEARYVASGHAETIHEAARAPSLTRMPSRSPRAASEWPSYPTPATRWRGRTPRASPGLLLTPVPRRRAARPPGAAALRAAA